jgi:hypothetical protein
VASLLESNLPEDIRPLSENRKRKLLTNIQALTDLIDTQSGLLSHLATADCITRRHADVIGTVASQSERNAQLLHILAAGSETHFDRFVDGLSRFGQQQVRRVLLEDGVVACLVAHLVDRSSCCGESRRRTALYDRTEFVRQPGASGVEQDKAMIVERFAEILKYCSPESQRRKHATLYEVVSVDKGVQLIAVSAQFEGVGLYYNVQFIDRAGLFE